MIIRILLVGLVCWFAPSSLVAQEEGKPADKPPPCAAPGHRQFDFWLGEWEAAANGKFAGTNKITSILGGCVIMEEWITVKQSGA
jgi:hypothetical protein